MSIAPCQPCTTGRQPSDGAAADQSAVRFRALGETFQGYLSKTPLAYTLFRAAECRRVRDVALVRPVLDLGCGAGDFAAYATDDGFDVGVDLLGDRVASATRKRGHRGFVQGDAARLPLADDSFRSVVALSVCEHFDDPNAAIREAFRVLRPGGRFVATIVLSDLHKHLFYPRLARRIGLTPLAKWYVRLHDDVFDHRAPKPRAWWEARLRKAGFRLITSRKIVAPRLASWFDFWLATAWPYRLWQRFGTPRVWRPTWLARRCWEAFQRLDGDQDDGAVLFVVAEKPGGPSKMAESVPYTADR
jgi:ubiquinone/menaquinone biosynthesis C-methylase UbiE